MISVMLSNSVRSPAQMLATRAPNNCNTLIRRAGKCAGTHPQQHEKNMRIKPCHNIWFGVMLLQVPPPRTKHTGKYTGWCGLSSTELRAGEHVGTEEQQPNLEENVGDDEDGDGAQHVQLLTRQSSVEQRTAATMMKMTAAESY